METIIEKDYAGMSERAADFVIRRLQEKPDLVLCLPTGATPLGMYARLAEAHARKGLDFSRATIFNLDEYLGIPAEHPGSCRFYLRENFLNKVNALDKNVFLISEENYGEYEEIIRGRGGIDAQILGIGRNGHIGFNEPGSAFDSRTRALQITETTIRDNARNFGGAESVPRRVVTLGIEAILKAREILLLASGEAKTEAIRAALLGPISPNLPASALQKHPKVTMMLDRAAARGLMKARGSNLPFIPDGHRDDRARE